jgi:hypothetical protein
VATPCGGTSLHTRMGASAGGDLKRHMLARAGKRMPGLAWEQSRVMHGSRRKDRNSVRAAQHDGEREDLVASSSHPVIAVVPVRGFAVHTHAAGSIKD